jgi:hypothetical protein
MDFLSIWFPTSIAVLTRIDGFFAREGDGQVRFPTQTVIEG